MEDGSPDYVPGQVFHGGLIPWKYTLIAEDPESGMSPVGKHGDQVLGNPPFGQEHFEDLVPQDGLELFQVQRRSNPEHAPLIEASVRYQDITMGIESQEIMTLSEAALSIPIHFPGVFGGA